MSNLFACPTCSKEISVKATACPGCGHQLRTPGAISGSDPVHIMGILLLLVIVIGVIAYVAYSGSH